jgi:kynureninase
MTDAATTPFSREQAAALDADDPLSRFRDRFYVHPGALYMDGNSLGLLSKDSEAAVLAALNQWKTLGIDGWLQADPPWFWLGEELGRRQAAIVGADADEVVVTGSITVNLHALVATLYQPTDTRRAILATALDFPSDIYALQAHIRARGGDPERDLLLAPSSDGRTVDEDALIEMLDERVALASVPSVLYRSGQLLDMERITRIARERGVIIGWDCAHSAGVIPHHFSEWGADFGVWCTYKYLNSGPGAVGALYLNRRHFDKTPALPGWWGYAKERQFDMLHDFEHAQSAGGWQISTIGVLSAAPLVGALAILHEAGIENVRARSQALTEYLIACMEQTGLTSDEYGYAIGSPRDAARRGGHVAVEHPAAPQIVRALKARGVVPDFRPPNVIRLAPVPLYVSYTDVWDTVQHLREIIASGEYRTLAESRELVS